MADLKPLGSEKLNGDEKLKRILELTYYNEKNKKSSTSRPELVKESKTGCVYGIVKEKDGYYVKSGLNESSLDYIGGMFMKNKNRFSSYSEALKRLELLKGQEELNEATKYVLKQKGPQDEAPMPAPVADEPTPAPDAAPAPSEPSPVADAPSDSAEPAPSAEGGEGSGEPKRSDYMAEVQKYAGKLGQELRDLHDKMESDDIKYVLNMIISAVDLDKLDDEDIEEIGKKFDRDEEEGGETPSEEPSAEDDVPAEEPAADEDLGEDFSMDALENFINTPVEADEVDLSKYADLEEKDLNEIGYSRDPNAGPDDYNYDPFEMDANLSKKRHELKKMGHSDDVAWGRTYSDYAPTKTFYDNIDMTPPRPKIGSHGEDHMEEEVEIDLDEIKREINDSINTTLGKYFK